MAPGGHLSISAMTSAGLFSGAAYLLSEGSSSLLPSYEVDTDLTAGFWSWPGTRAEDPTSQDADFIQSVHVFIPALTQPPTLHPCP